MPELFSAATLFLILKTWLLLLATALLGWWLRGLFTGKGKGGAGADTSQWKERYDQASREREDLRQKFEKLTADHAGCGAVRAELEKLQSTAIDKSEYDSLQAQLDATKATLEEKDGRIVEIISARDKARADLEANRNSGIDPREIQRLQKRVEERDNQLGKLRHDLGNAGGNEKRIASRDAEIERLKSELAEAQSNSGSTGGGAVGLAAGAAAGVAGSALLGGGDSGGNAAELQARVDALEVARERLRAERDDARAASANVSDQTGDIASLKADLASKDQEISSLKAANADTGEVDDLRRKVDARDVRISKLESELASAPAAAAETAPPVAPAQNELPKVEEEPEPDRPSDVSGYSAFLSQYQGEDVEAQVQPGVIFKSRPSCIDDLKEIKGVGPALEKTLHENGVYRFQQVADWNQYNIWFFNKIMAFPGRIQRDEWIAQARDFAPKSKCRG